MSVKQAGWPIWKWNPNLPRYKVLVDDNFHHLDETSRSELGTFDTADEAVAARRRVVDSCLRDNYEPGMCPAELYRRYIHFGDDPFIVVLDAAAPPVSFSAWNYANERCQLLCRTEEPERAPEARK